MPSYPSSLKPNSANLNGLAPSDDVKLLIAQGDNTTLSSATSYTDQKITKITNQFLGGEVDAALDSFFELVAKLDADDNITNQILRDLAAKVDKTSYDTFVQSVNTALANKADTGHSHSDYAIKSTYDNFVTQTNNSLGQKVDKEAGKGLSTNDFTAPEKTKLAKLVDSYVQNQLIHVDAAGNLVSSGTTLTQLAADIAAAQTNSLNSSKAYADQKYTQLKTELMGGDVSAALDTFKDIQEWITDAQTATAAILQDLAAKLDKTTYDAFVTATNNSLTQKADKTAYDNFVSATNNALALKLNTSDKASDDDVDNAIIGKLVDARQLRLVDEAALKEIETRFIDFRSVTKLGRNYHNLTSYYAGTSGSGWAVIKTNVGFGSNTIINLNIDMLGMLGLSYANAGTLRISFYGNNGVTALNTMYYGAGKLNPVNALFHITNIDDKYAIAIKRSAFGYFAVSSPANHTSNLGITSVQAENWTVEAMTEEQLQIHINAEPRSVQSTINQLNNYLIADTTQTANGTANALIDAEIFKRDFLDILGTASGIAMLDANSKISGSQIPKASTADIAAGTDDAFIDSAQFKALKDSLNIWELDF